MQRLESKNLVRIIFLFLILLVIIGGYILYNHSKFVIHYFNGNKFYKEKKFDKAVEEYKKALKIYKDNAYLYNNLGISYYSNGHLEKALECYKESIKLNPNLYMAYNNRGVLYDSKGAFEAAIREYKKAIGIKPNYAEAYKNLGIAFYKRRNYNQAAESFEKYLIYIPEGTSDEKWVQIIRNLRERSKARPK